MALKIILVILLAAVKYFFTFPYSLIIGLDFDLAMPLVIVGGVAGFLFFYYLSKHLIAWFHTAKPIIFRFVPRFIMVRYSAYCERRNKKTRKVFTRKSRIIAKIRGTYGLWGIIVTTPVLLTIPLGAFLASKYYSRRKNVVLYMVLSILVWGAAMSAFLHVLPADVK